MVSSLNSVRETSCYDDACPVSDAKIGESKESEQTDAMQTNIAKMKEMGIQDEGLARKALTVMNGDLQAAIDLIFSGWLGEDESAN